MNIEKLAEQKIMEITHSLKNSKINLVLGEQQLKKYNYEIELNKDKEKLKVLVYFGKKGVKIVIQGNKNSKLYKQVNELLNDEPELNLYEREIIPSENYIGSDESGKGDFFGPLVTAAVYVNRDNQSEFLKIGVRDSKDMTDMQIYYAAKKIKKVLQDSFEIIVINPVKYNELYSKFRNMNEILAWSHSKAIENLAKKCNCKEVIIDQFSSKIERVNQKLLHLNLRIMHSPKAERFLGVAAASILARDKFNAWFNIQSIRTD
jgi:ribonuclease HIII